MVGLTLGCHGPCVGVGGGLDGETDAWLTAVSLLQQETLPGMWMVFSGWEPEVQMNIEGAWLGETRCTALAMALQPVTGGHDGLRLRVVYDSSAREAIEIPAKSTAISLFEGFSAAGMKSSAMTAMLGGGLRAEIDWPAKLAMPAPNSTSQRKRLNPDGLGRKLRHGMVGSSHFPASPTFNGSQRKSIFHEARFGLYHGCRNDLFTGSFLPAVLFEPARERFRD